MALPPGANARSMSTLAKQPRLRRISFERKRSSGSATKSSSPIFWRSSCPMAPGFAAVLRFVIERARCWGSLSIITCVPIWSLTRLRRWLLRCLAASGIAKRRKQYGAVQTRSLLLQKGFVLSMSRAGTPTDNGYAERFVGVFKLAVADRRPYHTLGEFLRAAQAWINFYNQERPHEGLDNLSPLQFAQQHELEDIPSFALL